MPAIHNGPRARHSDARDDDELSPDEIELANGMKEYMARWRVLNPTSGQILDVMMSAGWVHTNRDFKACVAEFAQALHQFKRAKGRPRPSWRNCLAIAKQLGWTRGEA